MIGRDFHAQPGIGSEYGAGFVGLLVNIGIPAEDNVLGWFFGFVEMDDANEGQKAIDALNEKELGGRTLRVNEARPRD